MLTIVSATAVLGSRLVLGGYRTPAAALLVLAAIEWAVLSGPVLRRWVTPTVGISFVAGVAADSVALLSAMLAVPYRTPWLGYVALALILVALGLYAFAAARFDLRQLLSGRGDHWIAGGALAISALSAARATEAAGALALFGGGRRALEVGTLVLWCAALAWLPVLIVTEAVEPRLSYGLSRWATGFPIGMYAACSFAVGEVTGIAGIVDFVRVWTWVALASTVILLAGLFRSLSRAPEIRRLLPGFSPGHEPTGRPRG